MPQASAIQHYVDEEQALYDELAAKVPELRPILDRVPSWLRKSEAAHRRALALGIDIPQSLLKPYNIDKNKFFIDIDLGSIAENGKTDTMYTMIKYQLRGYNILRELARISVFAPELLQRGEARRIVELSPGGCGTGEIAAHYDNSYRAAEFLEGRGGVYRLIHEALSVDIQNFDGRSLPYPFEDDAADVLFCHQAIDAYGPPRRYPAIVKELRRIARKVVITFNPYRANWNRGNIRQWRPVMLRTLDELFPDARRETDPVTRLPALIWEN